MGGALTDRIAMLFRDADTDGNGNLSRMEFQEVSQNVNNPRRKAICVFPRNLVMDRGSGHFGFQSFQKRYSQLQLAQHLKWHTKLRRSSLSQATPGTYRGLIYGQRDRQGPEPPPEYLLRTACSNVVVYNHPCVRLQVLRLFGEEIGLTPKDVLKIMAEADSNDDDVIDYEEFLPVATELIQVWVQLSRCRASRHFIAA